jgi:glyoxylate/hydroxypyruvate reductase
MSIDSLQLALTCPNADEASIWCHVLTLEFAALGVDAKVSAWPQTAASVDYAIGWGVTQAFVDAHADAKGFFTLGAGVDGLLKLQLPESMPIVRIEDGGMAAQMAEYVCHAVLRHTRQLDTYERSMRAGAWQQLPERSKREFPVGVMGLGVLGAHVAGVLAALGFSVNGWSRSAKAVQGIQCSSGEAELDDFLRASRILVCLLPLTPDTRDIVNLARLNVLQKPGYLINVARGAHVVDEDLLAALDSGQIAGATLDVFRTEPLPADHAFRQHPQIQLTPHIAAQTVIVDSARQIAGKILALRRGEAVSGVVDRALGY